MIVIRVKDGRNHPFNVNVTEIISIDGIPWSDFTSRSGDAQELTELRDQVRILNAAVGKILNDFYTDDTKPTLEPQSEVAASPEALPPEQDRDSNGS